MRGVCSPRDSNRLQPRALPACSSRDVKLKKAASSPPEIPIAPLGNNPTPQIAQIADSAQKRPHTCQPLNTNATHTCHTHPAPQARVASPACPSGAARSTTILMTARITLLKLERYIGRDNNEISQCSLFDKFPFVSSCLDNS